MYTFSVFIIIFFFMYINFLCILITLFLFLCILNIVKCDSYNY